MGHFNMGFGAAFVLVDLHPELADFRLGSGIRHPFVAAMFILAAHLAAVATRTLVNVYDKSFHFDSPSTHDA
jgi:hypothetical protein